jgi:hypothetical protein
MNRGWKQGEDDMRRLIVVLGVTSMMTLGTCLVEGPGSAKADELGQNLEVAQQETETTVSEGFMLIFADGFESGDTAFWVESDCLSTVIMPTAVTE